MGGAPLTNGEQGAGWVVAKDFVIISLPNKYTSSNLGLRGQLAFFLDLVLMREMPVGDVSFILNGKSGRLIIITSIIL